MQQKESWIDDVKVIACMLVLFGHLMQSMTSSNIVSGGELYQWFNKTIYYFHVPLFFICSGYLYQRNSCVNSLHSWGRNVLKKLLALGVPYFTFTIATWFIKMLIPEAGNNKIDSIFSTLFFQPTAPYWYLYALFFLFLITPTFGTRKNAGIGFLVALLMKGISITGMLPDLFGGIYAISVALTNEIWFVIGMHLCVFEVPQIWDRKRPQEKVIIDAGLSTIFSCIEHST